MESGEPKKMTNVLKAGFLKKRSKYLHLWKTRFCILTKKFFFAFTGIEKDTDCTMTLELEKCKDCWNTDEDIGKHNSFSIRTNNMLYYFMAENENERNEWISLIKANLSVDDEQLIKE